MDPDRHGRSGSVCARVTGVRIDVRHLPDGAKRDLGQLRRRWITQLVTSGERWRPGWHVVDNELRPRRRRQGAHAFVPQYRQRCALRHRRGGRRSRCHSHLVRAERRPEHQDDRQRWTCARLVAQRKQARLCPGDDRLGDHFTGTRDVRPWAGGDCSRQPRTRSARIATRHQVFGARVHSERFLNRTAGR